LTKRVGVHPLALKEFGVEDALVELAYLGYSITELSAFNFALDYDYIIDSRVPEWRGWRLALSEIEWRYPNEMAAFRKMKKEHPLIVVEVEEVDSDLELCNT
jgi:hypothetical protein